MPTQIKKPYVNRFALFFAFLAFCGCSRPDDIRKKYYDSGELMSVIRYKQNLKDKEAVFFYKSGDTLEVQSWMNGRLNGKSIKFRENGIPKYIAVYSNDIIRKTLFKDQEGRITKRQLFNEDGYLTHELVYDSTGKLKNQGPWLMIRPDFTQLKKDSIYKLKAVVLNFDTTQQFSYTIFQGTDSIRLRSITENQSDFELQTSQSDTLRLNGILTVVDASRRGDGLIDTIRSQTEYEFLWEYSVVADSI